MRILIIGGGKVGLTITEYLRNENHDIAVIDTDGSVIEYVATEYDVLGIQGSGVRCDILRQANADKADLVIATAPEDEVNILACTIAKQMGAARCIARVRDPHLAQQFPFMQDELGLSALVNPEYDAATEIARMIRLPSAIKVDSFAKGRMDLAEMKIEEGSKLDGLSLHMLPKIVSSRVLICAVTRETEVFIPSGDFVLRAGDRLHVTATHQDLVSFFKSQGMQSSRIHHVMLIGGGRIAYYLTRQLLDLGISVKIIEKSHARCLELSKHFPKAKIICGEETDQNLLIAEGVAQTDACVVLTETDEENIIISMFVKSLGSNKLITKIGKPTLKKMTESVGLDSIVSPKMLTANMIIQYARAMQNVGGSKISTLYKLVNDRVEAIEFVARENSHILNIPLRKLKLIPNLLLAGIIRSGKVIIPSGNDWIEEKDSVVIVTTNRYLEDLDEIVQ